MLLVHAAAVGAADDDSNNFNVKVKAKTILTQSTFAPTLQMQTQNVIRKRKKGKNNETERVVKESDALRKTFQTNTWTRKNF